MRVSSQGAKASQVCSEWQLLSGHSPWLVGILEGKSHFGSGCLDEKDSSFPIEGKPRTPVFQGHMRRDAGHAKGIWTSQAKPTRPDTDSLGSMGPCSVTMAVSYWFLGSVRPSCVTVVSCFHGAPQCHNEPLFPSCFAVSECFLWVHGTAQ